MGSFTYLGSTISKYGGSSEDVKSKIAKVQDAFFTIKKVLKNRKISMQTKIRIMECTVMTMVKFDGDLQDVFQRNCLQIVLGTRLTDRMSNCRLYKKLGSIQLARAIKKKVEMARARSVDEG